MFDCFAFVFLLIFKKTPVFNSQTRLVVYLTIFTDAVGCIFIGLLWFIKFLTSNEHKLRKLLHVYICLLTISKLDNPTIRCNILILASTI